MRNYVVREGDTFSGISKYYYKTTKLRFFLALINWNMQNGLKEGERIFVPNRYNIAFVISLAISFTSIIILLTK